MEFFCYHRDRPDSAALRDELLEEHWSYMDRYVTEMIARGPTFGRGISPAAGTAATDTWWSASAPVRLPTLSRRPARTS